MYRFASHRFAIHRGHWALAMLALFSCTAPSAGPGHNRDGQLTSGRGAAVDALVKPLIDDDWVVGLSIALYERGRVTYHNYGRRAADATDAPTADTIYEIGSVSKVLTAMLLAHAVTRGELALDAPVNSLLPARAQIAGKGGVDIILEHLATHQSGLPRMPDNFAPADPQNPYIDYTVDMLYAFLSKVQLTRVPGTGYEYSNVGAALLGHVLALHLATPYEQAVRERILRPMGMDSTAIELDERRQSRMAQGYNGAGEPARRWDLPVLAGAGAWRSSARDMLALVRGNLEGKAADLAAAMRLTHGERYEFDGGQHMGLGWHIDKHGARWHNGATGGFFSFVAFDPRAKTCVVVLANTQTNVIGAVGDALLNMLASRPYKLDLPATVKLDPAIYDRYVGRYLLSQDMMIDITRTADALYLAIRGQPRVRLYPMSETRFYMRVVEAIIEFEVDTGSNKASQLLLLQGGSAVTAPRIP